MQTEIDEIVKLSLKKAVDHDTKGKIGQAYAYYTTVLEFCPLKRVELEKRFTRVLCEWGIYLEQKGRFSDVIKCYKNSLELYPKSPTILNNFAAHFLRNEDYPEAIKYLHKALEADENYLPAVRNLQNAYSSAVDRWHFIMLNDAKRNEAFRKAIKKKVLLGYDTVLDVGTGSGLLSLYAHDAGAKEIYACEYSPVMCEIAKKVYHKNKAEDIKLICKASNDLRIPQDIPKRVKLIVTEIFDAALFGEYVIPTLADAHKKLLINNDEGVILPMSATLYVAAIECKYIQAKSHVIFDESQKYGCLDFENIVLLSDEDFYDTENLKNVDVKYITEAKPILQIDFNDLGDLENLSKDGVKEIIPMKSRCSGVISGLVAWFRLNLDEDIQLDSSDKESCWQLAVFPVLPQLVNAGDQLVIVAQIYNGRLKCTYKLHQKRLNFHEKLIYQLPKDVITLLNDKEYIHALSEAAKSKKKEHIKTIFDTSPFPFYGLSVLKENSTCEVLYCQTNNEALKHFIDHVIQKNSIAKKVCYVSDFSEIFDTLDNIFVHNFDSKGEMIDWGQQTYREMYSCLLSSSGTLLPERIFLMGQLVYSKELTKMISVKDFNIQESVKPVLNQNEESFNQNYDDENDDCDLMMKTENLESNGTNYKYKVAEFMNKYKINQVFDLNSTLYSSINMSEAKILTEIDESEMKEEIINFGKIELKNKKIIPNALICWYKIDISDNNIHETKKNNSFMNHTAIVFEDELEEKVCNNEEVNIKIQQMRDIVRISVL